MIKINTIYNQNCLDTLNMMYDSFLDLTITSPPYNVDLKYDVYADNVPYYEYLEELKSVFSEVYNKTKSGGRCIINIGDKNNGRVSLHSDIIQMMKNIGWLSFCCIIWNKNTTCNRAAWGSYLSPSCPSFPTPFEYILGFSKDNLKLSYKGESDLLKEEFISWTLPIWSFSGNSDRGIKHPAPFPIELPTRCIKLFSWKNAIVYDPFMGSGTTAIACKNNNRNFIGSEISKEYYLSSLDRINLRSKDI